AGSQRQHRPGLCALKHGYRNRGSRISLGWHFNEAECLLSRSGGSCADREAGLSKREPGDGAEQKEKKSTESHGGESISATACSRPSSVRKFHRHSGVWPQRYRRLDFDAFRSHSKAQAESLRESREHDQNFGHREVEADACTRPCSKWQICATDASCGVFGKEAFRAKCVGFFPVSGIAMSNVGKDEDL